MCVIIEIQQNPTNLHLNSELLNLIARFLPSVEMHSINSFGHQEGAALLPPCVESLGLQLHVEVLAQFRKSERKASF